MSTTTFFRTQRLDARLFVPADVHTFVGYRADPEVARYQSWSDYTVADGTALVAAMQEAARACPVSGTSSPSRTGRPARWWVTWR